MVEYTKTSRLAITSILTPEVILAAICSLASQFVSQNSEAVANATEKIMQAYNGLNANISSREIRNNENNHSTYTLFFDKNAALDPSLSPVDKAVYHVLLVLADNETQQCSPKIETIATHAFCSQRAVYRSLNTLEAIGAIKRTSRFRCHRQISSIYKIIGYKTTANTDTNTQHSADIVANTRQPADNTDYHSSAIADDTCTANEMTACQGITMPECQTVVSVPNCQTEAMPPCQGEKILRIFNNSLKGGAPLPAKAEKNREEPQTKIPKEKTKDSLTGGAPLPKPTASTPQPPTKLEGTSETTTCTSKPPAKPSLIRAKSEGTPQDDAAHEKTVEPAGDTLKFECETLKAALAAGKTFQQWAWEHHERQQKRHEERLAALKAAQQAANEVTAPGDEMPQPGTPEFLRWKYKNTRKACEEMLGHSLDSPQPKSVADIGADVLAKIMKRTAIRNESTVPTEESGNLVAQHEAMNEYAAPTTSTKTTTTGNIPAAKTACDTSVFSPKPADPAPESAETASVNPVAADKTPAPKKPTKGKVSDAGSSKDIYSPDYAPEVMRPTAEFFLLKTGRKGLRWEEISVLRKLAARHYPTIVNKEILRACARFEKRNQSLKSLTFMYIWAALKDWSPTFGKKKKTKAEPEVKHEYTEEEKQAIQAEIDMLQAKFDEEAEQRRKCMRR